MELYVFNISTSSLLFLLNTKPKYLYVSKYFKHSSPFIIATVGQYGLTQYDPGEDFKSPHPLSFFALTHLILELHYCALGTFPHKIV